MENTDHYIVEVKKINEGDLFESFQWLRISKDFQEIKPLRLQSIDSSREVEERFFDEGYLKFNPKSGIFIEKFNSGQHQYVLRDGEMVSNLNAVLKQYFFGEKALVN